MRFVTLREILQTGKTRNVMINLGQVICIRRYGDRTHLYYRFREDTDYVVVEETPEEIIDMAEIDLPVAAHA